MDKIAQSNPDSVRDDSGFLMSCKATMSETTAKLIIARIALNTSETQRWSAKYMAPIRIKDPSHLPDPRETKVELPLSMFSEQWEERYEAARPNHFPIHQWLSSDIRVNEDVPLGTLPVDQLTIWTYKDVTDENAVAKIIDKCTYNFSDTISRMHKIYKLNKQGVRSTKAGTRLFPSDCPLKAPQITFQWGEIIHGHYFSTSYIGRVDLPPYWKAEGVVNGTLVVGVKWERQVPWEFDQSTHKEQETALSEHPDNIAGLANMNFELRAFLFRVPFTYDRSDLSKQSFLL
jgi:hypothetical protein